MAHHPTMATDAATRDLIAPRLDHDDLSFEELARVYSYDRISDRRRLFAGLVIKETCARQRPVRVMDIGCGNGMGVGPERAGYIQAIGAAADVMVGLEPDERVEPVPGVFDDFQHALLENARLEPGSIDVAYSYMVMEHVRDPAAFFAALHRVLVPGGTYLFITPNGRHLFTRISMVLHALKLDELVLRLIMGTKAEAYHYPVRYRCQTPEVIGPMVEAAGLAPHEHAYVERASLSGYFRGPLRPVLTFLAWKRRRFRKRECLLNLIGRVSRPG